MSTAGLTILFIKFNIGNKIFKNLTQIVINVRIIFELHETANYILFGSLFA